MLAQGLGIIDPFFCGDKDEIQFQIYNMTNKPATVNRGDQIIQGIVIKYETVQWDEVSEMNEKGDGGYWAVQKNISSNRTEEK